MQYFLCILVIFWSRAESTQYVQSDTSSLKDCPGQPCLPFSQYIQESSRYFTTGSVFVFLSGNHTVHSPLSIEAVSNVSFVGTDNSTLICTDGIVLNSITGFSVSRMTFVLHLSQENLASALSFSYSEEIMISDTVFKGNDFASGRAIASTMSNISVTNCHFTDNTGHNGGAILAKQDTYLSIKGSTFSRNRAKGSGGAIFAEESIISLDGEAGSTFANNSGNLSGGAISCSDCVLMISSNCVFKNNILVLKWNSTGGAIGLDNGEMVTSEALSFFNNSATMGGAISLNYSTAVFRQGSLLFRGNVAAYVGGGIYSNFSVLLTHAKNMTFIENTAKGLDPSIKCGVICLFVTIYIENNITVSTVTATLLSNSGEGGGAMFIEKIQGNLTLDSIYAEKNKNGALGILEGRATITGTSLFLVNEKRAIIIANSIVNFYGSTVLDGNANAIMIYNTSEVTFWEEMQIMNNIGQSGGGGINSTRSTLSFRGKTLFFNNTGSVGGALAATASVIEFRSNVAFIGNQAIEGGGLYASDTIMNTTEAIALNFSHNVANRGGGIYMRSGATLFLNWYTILNTSHNIATEYGGAIYHEDLVKINQCSNVTRALYSQEESIVSTIPKSFLQIIEAPADPIHCPEMHSYNNSARRDGNFLYGGLLDRSSFPGEPRTLPYDYLTAFCHISMQSLPNNTLNDITSAPFLLTYCGSSNPQEAISVYRGQTFTLDLVALGQGGSTVPTIVTALISPTARLKLNQSSQTAFRHCSQMTYNLFSTMESEKLTLFPDGPCQTLGQASTVLNVTLLPCPDAFQLLDEECVCEERLAQFNATCEIEDGISIWRTGITFWMNASYFNNGSYEGLILYHVCPNEYCSTDRVNISLDNPDTQCAFNRSGMLCGSCADGYSLMLGGFRCGICSNMFLFLILPFALAGIALIILLSLLKLTVANGTINSLILYANIVQINRGVFFPSDNTDVLTVFIAWMNLDFGFKTCFYDGMNVYAQTWLQFVFSAYVWIMISVIIIASRYSSTASKLIGSNPVAVLATLLLMSYNKILKIIIDVFSSVNLEYPDAKLVTVWLRDGNVSFLHSKHLILAIITLFILVFAFLPYTTFLLLGHLLYRLPYRRYYYRYLVWTKSLLDCYHAPYKVQTRFWTGFLLLVRCALYVVFSFNSLGGTKYSLLSIIIAFSSVGSLFWLLKGVYKRFYIDVIEVSVYINLIILSATAATLSEASMTKASYSLVGIVFCITLGVMLHHIHLRVFAKTALWLKMKSKFPFPKARPKSPIVDTTTPNESTKIVSKTVINLREPLLEN